MSSMSFCTKYKRPTHLALLNGKPSHPRDPDFNLLECKDCYGEVEWFDGDTKLVLKWNPLRGFHYASRIQNCTSKRFK